MSSSVRQSNLFVAEDWQAIYRSFQDVSFKSYDFETIRDSLIDYIRVNYPEKFNDYIDSSEFIAVIELLAWLGMSLNFRVDLNARENFLDTAERRESIVRLARMLNYQPRRNIAATGLVKLTAVETNEPVTDSQGRNLGRVRVFWNDPNNPDSQEQFIAVLNAAFAPTNPFGRPQKSGSVGNIPTDLYRLENAGFSEISYGITTRVRNDSIPIDIVNVDFRDGETFFERHPNPDNPFHVVYRNDGEGEGSPNTGFFLHFRQGNLQSEDVAFDVPRNNRVYDIDVNNINETDVYLQEINSDGDAIQEWTRVPSLVGNNVIYNNVNPGIRDIYTVIPRLNDQITLRFSDGNFGRVPQGIYRAWYRVSANRSLILRPDDLQNSEIRVPYRGQDGETYTLQITFSLVESVSNAAPTETDDQIRQRAPQVFYTQNRMVNGEDYNVFPLTRGNELLKIKAINRTHAGHSRFIDINDPTGTIQNTLVFGEDGALWADSEPQQITVSTDVPIDEIAEISITEFIRNQFLQNFFYSIYLERFRETLDEDAFGLLDDTDERFYWLTDPRRDRGSQGEITTVPSQSSSLTVGPNGTFPLSALRFVRPGSKILFVAPDEPEDEEPQRYQWVTVRSITTDGASMLELSELVEDGWVAWRVLPAFRRSFNELELDLLLSETSPVGQLTLNSRFGLGYDIETDEWFVNLGAEPDENFELPLDGEEFDRSARGNWLLYAENRPADAQWIFTTRGRRYVFESADQARFFFDENFRITDVRKGRALRDTVELLSCNTRLNPVLPVIEPPPPPTLSGTHTGGSCTVQVGESCTAEGTLTATLGRALRTQPPYTWTFERISGAEVDTGFPLTATTNQPEVSLAAPITGEATEEGANQVSSRYRVTVIDGGGLDFTTNLVPATYTFNGTAVPPVVINFTGCTTVSNSNRTCGGSSETFLVGGPQFTLSGGSDSANLSSTVSLLSVTASAGGFTITNTNYSTSQNRTTVTWTANPGSNGTRTLTARYEISVTDSGTGLTTTQIRECQSQVTWNCPAIVVPPPPPPGPTPPPPPPPTPTPPPPPPTPTPVDPLVIVGSPSCQPVTITGTDSSGSFTIPFPSVSTSGGSGGVTESFTVNGVTVGSGNVSATATVGASGFDVSWSSTPGTTGTTTITVQFGVTVEDSAGATDSTTGSCGASLSWQNFQPLAASFGACAGDNPPQFLGGGCSVPFEESINVVRPPLNVTGGSGDWSIVNPTCNASGSVTGTGALDRGASCANQNSTAIFEFTLNTDSSPSWSGSASVTGEWTLTVRDNVTNEEIPLSIECTRSGSWSCGLDPD